MSYQVQIRKPIAAEIVLFVVHVSAIYLLVIFCAPWLAGFSSGRILPMLHHASTSGKLQFFFNHLFVFSFIPGLVGGLLNAKFANKAAYFAWVIPAIVLIYHIATFTSPTVIQTQSGLHYYFADNFLIPEYTGSNAFWAGWRSNPDVARGLAQHAYTAPFYAGIAYSVAAFFATASGKIYSPSVAKRKHRRPRKPEGK